MMPSTDIKINDYQNGKDKEWAKQHPGRQTASITKPIELPVKWLITLEGLRGEDSKLKFSMSKIKGMSESCVLDKKWRDKNPMTLEVHHDGDIYVFDGNHRSRAAKLARLKTFPCVVNFYGCGEDKIDFNKIIKKYASENTMTSEEKQINAMYNLVAKAKIALEAGLNHQEVIAEITKLASESGGNLGGDTDTLGSPTDQEYSNERDSGTDYGGENNPDKGNISRTGPRDNESNYKDEKPNDMVQEASSSVSYGLMLDLIKQANRLTKLASHMEEIEIPFSDIHLENGIDYKMSGVGAQQNVFKIVDKYLKMNVYPGTNRRFSIAYLEQSNNKIFVKVLVFDNQINHEANQTIDTNNIKLNKVSSVKSNKMQKTAWKLRLTEPIGDNDQLGLVKCPLENNFLVRACGTCPFAGNPATYIADGGTQCHFDEGQTWLDSIGVKEHRPLDNSSNG